MKIDRGNNRCGARAATVLAALVAAGAVAVPAHADEVAELPAFGMLGLSRGQTAVLNLVLTGPEALAALGDWGEARFG